MPEEQASGYDNQVVRLTGDFADDSMRLKSAIIEEGLSTVPKITLDLILRDRAMRLQDIVGKQLGIELESENSPVRRFKGLCVSCQYLGDAKRFGIYRVEVRPWLWLLSKRMNNRAFQDMKTSDVIKQVLTDAGFSGQFDINVSGEQVREFCLQYRESDLTFLNRLMEEEGIYYFVDYGDGLDKETVHFVDSFGAHQAIAGDEKLPYFPPQADFRRDVDHVFDWVSAEDATFGKVTMRDYDFERPGLVIEETRTLERGEQPATAYETYLYPARNRKDDKFSRVRMEAEAIQSKVFRGVANARHIAVGSTFKLAGHPRDDGKEFLVTRTTHYINVDPDPEMAPAGGLLGAPLDMGQGNEDFFRTVFEAVPKTEQFRPPHVTPWPEIAGIQTAVVVGKNGEEIYTDQYGRIRIQFHWDRKGKTDEKSSIWVRTMMPWTGTNWGMIHIPRIGQEVVVQFEEGNPDRPVVIGMLYNGANKPPYALPENQTISGIKTNSSKGGEGYNELIFDDKKDKELVRLQAEKDFKQIVKNNAVYEVGTVSDKGPGDMTLTVRNHLTETVKEGDHSFAVKTGKQTLDIKTDKAEKIGGKSDLTISQNYSTTIEQGNLSEAVKMGNHSTVLDMGDYTIDVKLGKVEIKAMQSITLTVGTNSVKIDPSGVTISGLMVKLEGSAMLEAKAPVTQVKGDGVLILKGGITMIN